MKLISVCSLFAGIGGIDLGFKQAGFNIIWANERDEAACKTYAYNHKEEQLYRGDIRSVAPQDIPEFDVLIAGFPCQPFSIAGRRKGFDDPRGNLFFEISKIIDVRRPSVVFLENVENLINHDNGKTFLVIYSSLAQFGYAVRYRVLSATDYGNLPQTRRRTYIIAFKDLNACNRFQFPQKTELTTGINDIIKRNKKQHDIYYYAENSSFFNQFSNVVTDKTSIYRMSDKGAWRVQNHMCPTLTANMGTYPDRVPVIRDEFGIRKLTLRECLSFQGFPETFYFPNTITVDDAYKQIGNSVCVPVIKSLAVEIMRVMTDEKNEYKS